MTNFARDDDLSFLGTRQGGSVRARANGNMNEYPRTIRNDEVRRLSPAIFLAGSFAFRGEIRARGLSIETTLVSRSFYRKVTS